MSLRAHITGAPGSGKTTISYAIAKRLRVPHIDADRFTWEETDPPYRQKIELNRRREMIDREIRRNDSWVLSGSIHYWGDDLYQLCNYVVLIITATNIRMKRLRGREYNKFGARIETGGDLYVTHIEFMNKAGLYDSGDSTVRSLARDTEWLDSLPCHCLCIDGGDSLDIITKNLFRCFSVS